ncbi:DUF1192 domain-containing protein [Methylobacterium sp.]|uniref:DUF1192 domain-containing protein n=1 Tax=Methylobacterium sp. TaxID=409 RepID=UPI0025D7B368|nr:DUF1192 domain-containing protein [Methylobacterium sp.]MBY0259300.1 DUF1192 domain-containing protein [Methylobacterium sp.]
MRDEDDGSRHSATAHRIGEPLDTLSVEDLAERVAVLRAEIARIEAARDAKEAALARASSIFRL